MLATVVKFVGLGLRYSRKIVRVTWDKVCELKEKGDLWVINIRRFNYIFLEKWIWRLMPKKSGLWKDILDSKYGGWRNLRS